MIRVEILLTLANQSLIGWKSLGMFSTNECELGDIFLGVSGVGITKKSCLLNIGI